MTNFIEEMMQTAGVSEDMICKYAQGNIVYPTFTAEKQLEVIKLIENADWVDGILIYFNQVDKEYCFEAYMIIESVYENREVYIGRNQDFTQALAQLTTELMKAGELDKEKVREILQ